ncbi:MAG: hypothetical protein QGG40_09585, partial [Myxococcota bacterium]|nr:hypothetical protein [Myxococcota bacterium]
ERSDGSWTIRGARKSSERPRPRPRPKASRGAKGAEPTDPETWDWEGSERGKDQEDTWDWDDPRSPAPDDLEQLRRRIDDRIGPAETTDDSDTWIFEKHPPESEPVSEDAEYSWDPDADLDEADDESSEVRPAVLVPLVSVPVPKVEVEESVEPPASPVDTREPPPEVSEPRASEVIGEPESSRAVTATRLVLGLTCLVLAAIGALLIRGGS